MKSHFELFGLPPRFDLDVESLERRFHELCLEHHPDRVKADAQRRRAAVEETTSLNEGFRVLKDPVRRAFYLLKLHGVDLDEDGSAQAKSLPVEFLEEVMDLREQLEAARPQRDLNAAQALAQRVTGMKTAALEAARVALDQLAEGPNEQALRTAAHQLGRVRYFTRFLEEVELFEQEALG